MLKNRIFYTFKPLIPRPFQIFVRRRIAAYKRKKYAAVWPIDPAANQPPEGWQGWPNGKKFALVLSHDVDTKKGYDRVLQLAELEQHLGFRSAFNFVPERYGEVSADLRQNLVNRGFEINVHGLKHDGKLYLFKRTFERRAPRINAYLRQWNTTGFTSPSMHHKLEWTHRLDVNYCISTFDTDPFEPQPDGVGTIFPFWVAHNSSRGGFVELPYTLPQDSTLFIILQEKNIDIWKAKLDWIASHGGMALLNSHPDYMDFEHSEPKSEAYPVENYIQFLKHIKQRYEGQIYHALPHEIANFWRQRHAPTVTLATPEKASATSTGRRALRVCMLTYSFYETDNRVRRYAETLARRGDEVEVISLRRAGQSDYNELNGVKIYRIQQRVRNERAKFDFLLRISRFLMHSALILGYRQTLRPYDLVHVHSVPDFAVFSALIPKLLGAKIILDIHDIVPEFYASKFHVGYDSRIYAILVYIEKISAAFANHVIISNDLWGQKLIARSCPDKKCTVIMNYPDDQVFKDNGFRKNNEKFVFLYPGTLNHHQGLDIAIRAVALIVKAAPQVELHIYGEGPARKDLELLIDKYQVGDHIFLKDPVTIEEIVPVMAAADVGIIPKRNDDFGGEAFSTKTLEFMKLGVPIIVSRTKIDQYYFNDEVVRFFEPENVADLADAMLAMVRNSSLRQRLVANAKPFINKQSWSKKQNLYIDMVDALTGRIPFHSETNCN